MHCDEEGIARNPGNRCDIADEIELEIGIPPTGLRRAAWE
jgi:hypothetical protein